MSTQVHTGPWAALRGCPAAPFPRRIRLFSPKNSPSRPFAIASSPSRRVRNLAVRSQTSLEIPGLAERHEATMARFACEHADKACVAIIGDLHLKRSDEHLFSEARKQLTASLRAFEKSGGRGRVVQLGDLGSGKEAPGTRKCFDRAFEYLSGFGGAPFSIITGNHDLEGEIYESDEENLREWIDAFGQRHYWSARVGPALLIGLSTVRFRSNQSSHHEVHIDEEQLRWFEETVKQHSDVPIVVFSHAPPLGCGLKVLQDLHIKNRCCWLNHSGDPMRFMRVCQSNPNIRLWFSGHLHLSHNYRESISAVGSCTFVQTGVIGNCNRDGFRQSRVLRMDGDAFEIYTMDHDTGEERLDLRHMWSDMSPTQALLTEEELVCDPEAGWLCGRDACAIGDDLDGVKWFPAGGDCMLAQQGGLLVEYSVEAQAPMGVVTLDAAIPGSGNGWETHLVNDEGEIVDEGDGSDAVAVVLTHETTGEKRRFERNEHGTFFRVFQPNKWQKKRREMLAQQAALEPATADVLA